MTEFIIAAVLWGVLGLIGCGVLWVLTVGASGLLAIAAMEKTVPTWLAPTVFTAGIILTIGAFVLVVINVVTNIINAVNVGG